MWQPTMAPCKKWRSIAVAAAILCAAVPTVHSGEKNWLITPEEVVRLSGGTGEFKEPLAAKEGIGPLIVVLNPKALQSVTSPLDILVRFEPGQSGETPDMNSLIVVVVGFFNIDITDRVREYIQETRLEVVDADLPTGRHKIRMSINDIKGNANERDVIINVVER